MTNFKQNKKKIPAVLLAVTVLFTACKQFLDDPEEFLSYWASEAFVTDHSIGSAHRADGAGIECVGSSGDALITLTAHNPKDFTLAMPTSSAPAGIVEFKGLSVQPAAGTDYELKQTGSDTLELTYKQTFLQKYEQGSADLNPTITLKAQDGRVFKQAYTFSIKSNSPPPAPTVVLAKTTGTDPHYVLCLQFDSAEMEKTVTIGSGSVPVHKDIVNITINGSSYALLYKDDNSDFKKPAETSPIGSFIGSGEVAQLTTPPPGAWVLYFKTNVAVESINAQTSYAITLRDTKGITSNSVTAGIKEKFSVTFDAKGGSPVSTQYIENGGKVAKPSPNPTKMGYVFDDWYTDDTYATKWDFDNNTVTGNITLYANWISGNTTPYHVAHYKQKVDSDDYALADTETKNDGITDSIVNADSIKNDYEGFKYDHMLPNPPPAIAYDGTTRVKLYYNREQYDVSFSVVGNVGGSIAVTAATGASLPIGNPVKVKYYGSVTFTASPDTANNWEVEKWTVGGSVVPNHTSRTYTLSNIDGNKNVTVTFKKKFDVTFSVGYGQGGSLEGTYNGTTETTSVMQTIHVWEGGSVEFTALPDTANGWEVQSWMVDSATELGHTSETYTLSNVTQPKTVMVIFKKKTHTVTFSVDGGQGKIQAGSETPVTNGTIQVAHNGSVIFTASPDTTNGWEVEKWTLDGSTVNGTNTTYTLSGIGGPKNVKVTFKQKKYTVTFSVDGGHGKIKADSGALTTSSSVQVTHGDSVTFTAQPDNGWEVEKWTLDNSTVNGTNTTYTLSGIDGNKNVKVTFKGGVFNFQGGDGAWKRLKEEAEKPKGAHTIVVNGEITATGGDNAGEIKLGRNLTIKGSSSAVLNANGITRIFKVENGKTLILKDITLKNAQVGSTNEGGGVYIDDGGTLIMQGSSTITNCKAGKGGGVYVAGTFKMEGSALVNDESGTDNEVYLESGKTVTVTDTLTNEPAAKIKVADYQKNRVLAVGGHAKKENFKLAPDSGKNWRYKKVGDEIKFVTGKLTYTIEKIISVEEHDGGTWAEYYWTMKVDGKTLSKKRPPNSWKPETPSDKKKPRPEYQINESKTVLFDYTDDKTVGAYFSIKEEDHGTGGDDTVADVTKNIKYENDQLKFEGQTISLDQEKTFRLEFHGSGEGDVDVVCRIKWEDE